MNPNWRQIICDLRRAGMTTPVIANRVGACENTIYRYACGSRKGDPYYSLGAALLKLHARYVKGKR
jgi:hypothetical protein